MQQFVVKAGFFHAFGEEETAEEEHDDAVRPGAHVDTNVKAVFFAKRENKVTDDEDADGKGRGGFGDPEEDGEVEEEKDAVLRVGEIFAGSHEHQHQGEGQRSGEEEDFLRRLRRQDEDAVGVAGFHRAS